MENYGNDLFLSQEGYPSIDFTLLDRPSGSIASAPESTASLLPDLHAADSSFPSFDFFDGAGVESFGEASFRDHGSFRAELHKDVDSRSRRESSGQSSSILMQRQGGGGANTELLPSQFQLPAELQRPISNVDFFSMKDSGHTELHSRLSPCGNEVPDEVHDFFEQDNQQQQSGSGNWPWAGNSGTNDQPQLFYHGTYSTDEVNARNFIPLKADSFGANARMNYSGSALSGSEVANTDLGVSSLHSFMPTAGDSTDNRKSSQMALGLRSSQETSSSTIIKSQPRSQPLNVEGLLNGSPTNQFKPNQTGPIGNSTLSERHLSNVSNMGGQDGHVQNQNVRFVNQNLEGLAPTEVPSYDFLGNQLIWKGQGQGAFGQQVGGTGRPAGFDMQMLQQQSLQSLQLQELHRQLLAQQLKQHSEHSRQQQMQQQMVGNSYSSLLHGHDSPQPLRTSSGMATGGSENHSPAFLAGNLPNANTGGPGWPLNGSSYFQGYANDFLMGQDPNLAWQVLAPKGYQVDPSLYGAAAGSVLAFYPGSQNALPELYNGGLKLPSNPQVGKPVPRSLASGSSLTAEAQTDFFNAQNNDLRNKQQVYVKPFSGHNVQQSNEQPIERNQMANSLHQINMLSKSQHQFQDFQVNQQRNWGVSEQKRDAHLQSFSQTLDGSEPLPQSLANAQQSNLQNNPPRPHMNNLDARSRIAGSGQFLQQGNYQPGNSDTEGALGFKQQSCWSAPQSGASVEHPNEENERQHVDTWSGLHAHHSHADSGNPLQLLPNAKQNIWGGNFSQQNNYLIGNSFHSVNNLDGRQLGVHSVQSIQQGSSKDGRESPATLAGSSFQANQKSSHSFADLRARQESGWKENDRITETANTLQSSMELDGHAQSSWKNHNTPQQSAAREGTSGQSSDVDGGLQGGTWIQDLQQGNSVAEAPYRMKLALRKPSNASRQDIQVSQQARERLLSTGDAGQQQKQSQDGQVHLENQHAVNFAATPGEQDSKLVQYMNKEVGTPFHMLTNNEHAGIKTGTSDFSLQQENFHMEAFPDMMKTDVRQSNNHYGSNDQQNSVRIGGAFKLVSEKFPLQPGNSQVWSSLAYNTNLGQADMLDGSNAHHNQHEVVRSPQVSHGDTRQQMAGVGYNSHSKSPQREKDSHLQSFINSNQKTQSRLSRLNFNLAEHSTDESSVHKLSQMGTAPVPQWQHQTEKAITFGEMVQSDVHAANAPSGADIGQAKLSKNNPHPNNFLSMGKDFPYPRSQANVTPSTDAVFLKGVSASGSVSANLQTKDRSTLSSGVNLSSANKRNTLELLNNPGQSSANSSVQNLSVEKQRELSDQAEAAASSISLAHFRRNQSSSPLSPQSIRLGLAPPAHLSQILQQGGTINLSNFSHVQGLDGNVHGSGAVGKDQNVQAHPNYSGYGSQIARVERSEVSQGSGNILGVHNRAAQSPSATSLMQASNLPSFVSKDSMQSEHLPPSNLASGQQFFTASGEDAQMVAPSHLMMQFQNIKAAGSSQRESGVEGSFLPAATQLTRANASSSGYSQDKSLTDYIAQSSSGNDNPTQHTQLGSSRQNMQDRHIMNMTMHQLTEKAQTTDFSGLLTTFKTSLPGQQRQLAGHEKAFPGVFESFRPPSNAEPGDAVQMKLDAQGKANDTGKISVEGPSLVHGPRTGSQSVLDECSDPFNPQQEKSFSNLQSKLQEQRRPPGQVPISLLNCSGSNSLQVGPGQEQEQLKGLNHFSPLRTSGTVPLRSSTQLRGANRSALDKYPPAFLGQGQPAQQQTDTSSEGLSLSQTSENLSHSDARAAFFSEPAVITGGKLNEGNKKPPKNKSKPGISGNSKISVKGNTSQQSQYALAAIGQNKAFAGFKGMQQQNVTSPEHPLQNHQRGIDNLPLVHGQLPNQALDNLVVGASSISCMGKGMNSSHANAEAMYSSLPYIGNKNSEHLLASQASIYQNLNAVGRAQALGAQQFLGKNPERFLPIAGQSSRITGGMTDPILKEGESRFFARPTTSTLDQISQQHFSSLKSNFQAPVTVHPKKRRKLVPPLIPWHVAATQPGGQLRSISEAEFMWAAATNRLPEKDDEDAHDEGTSSVARAKRRLRLTTQLMQQLIPPLPSALMHGNMVEDNECATYNLARLVLADACRLVAGTGREAELAQNDRDSKNMDLGRHGNSGPCNNARDVAVTRIVERFMGNAKRLDDELARLEGSTSALELKCETLDLEKLSIVNRLAKHHGTGFSLESSENISLENASDSGSGIRRPFPQKYVTAVPMPRTLPEGVRCLSL